MNIFFFGGGRGLKRKARNINWIPYARRSFDLWHSLQRWAIFNLCFIGWAHNIELDAIKQENKFIRTEYKFGRASLRRDHKIQKVISINWVVLASRWETAYIHIFVINILIKDSQNGLLMRCHSFSAYREINKAKLITTSARPTTALESQYDEYDDGNGGGIVLALPHRNHATMASQSHYHIRVHAALVLDAE